MITGISTRLRGKIGRSGGRVTLVESVRQDRRRRLTIFDQEYVETGGGRTRRHRFSLTFIMLPLPQVAARVEKAGFRVTAVLGDYPGRAWDLRADVWLLLATRRSSRLRRTRDWSTPARWLIISTPVGMRRGQAS